MLKKLKLAVVALLLPLIAFAQSYPSPTFNNVTVQGTLTAATPAFTNPLPVSSGGTGVSSFTTGNVLVGAAGGGLTTVGTTSAGLPLISSGTGFVPVWTPLTLAGGGTSATTAAQARTNLGAAATATGLNQFASTTSAQLAGVISDETGTGSLVFAGSPALTGVPTAPTAAGSTNTTQIATTAMVQAALAGSVTGGRLLNIQVFTSGGTYTPTSGATKAIVDVMGGGGGGGGAQATSSSQWTMAGPGNGGARALIYIASGLSSQTVTVGSAGTAGAAGGSGGTGGASSFGSLVSCSGGIGGAVGTATSNTSPVTVIPPGTVVTCSGSGVFIVSVPGTFGTSGFVSAAAPGFALQPNGASTIYGSGGSGATTNPAAASGFGSGGSGFFSNSSTAAKAGAAGAPGIVIVYEFS